MRVMTEGLMSERQAAGLLRELADADIHLWVMGGWGVDALVGHSTRTHHDLDLFVDVEDLPALHGWLRSHAFGRAYEWQENEPISIHGDEWDTAFVERHADGREIDVHGIQVSNGTVRLATTDPWVLPHDCLTGIGQIDGHQVSCVSVQGQRAMHVGYELPEHHLDDVRMLEML